MSSGTRALTLTAALGCGLNAGVFFAFSAFVMRALDRLPASYGIAAMQSINVSAIRPAFMTALFGTAAICLILTVVSLPPRGEREAILQLAGSALYLVGTIGVTIIRNVPLNERLAAVDPSSAAAPAAWAAYAEQWTNWNHFRTATALAAFAAFTVALRG